MTAKPIEFSVDDRDRARLQILVDYFGDGNRADFLRVVIERMTREMRAEKLQVMQEQARVHRAAPRDKPARVFELTRHH
jgi:DNA-binding HxlR family transcriptional regulator